MRSGGWETGSSAGESITMLFLVVMPHFAPKKAFLLRLGRDCVWSVCLVTTLQPKSLQSTQAGNSI